MMLDSPALHRSLLRAAAVLLALVPLAAHSAGAARPGGAAGQLPDIVLEETSVRVLLREPGSRAVLLGLAQEERHFLFFQTRRSVLLEDLDGDGEAVLELDTVLPRISLWVAVDLATGDAVAAAPDGLKLNELPLSPQGLARRLDRFDLDLAIAEVLWVRPGTGAWGLRVGDGGEADDDGVVDGTARPDLTRMHGLGDAPAPPAELAGGDVVVVVDPLSLRLVIVRLTP